LCYGWRVEDDGFWVLVIIGEGLWRGLGVVEEGYGFLGLKFRISGFRDNFYMLNMKYFC
jgi:hypothetical protein